MSFSVVLVGAVPRPFAAFVIPPVVSTILPGTRPPLPVLVPSGRPVVLRAKLRCPLAARRESVDLVGEVEAPTRVLTSIPEPADAIPGANSPARTHRIARTRHDLLSECVSTLMPLSFISVPQRDPRVACRPGDVGVRRAYGARQVQQYMEWYGRSIEPIVICYRLGPELTCCVEYLE